jgi:hypothetical protein
MPEQKSPQQAPAQQKQASSKEAPATPSQAPAPAAGPTSAAREQSLLKRLDVLEEAVAKMSAEPASAPEEPTGPTKLELAQQYARIDEATDKLKPSKAKAYFKKELGDDFNPDDLMDYSVRGPYLVGVLTDNGKKVVVEHDLEVDHVPAIGEKGRAQMTDEEYERQVAERKAAQES